ncbi:PilZ domain-containing protein [Giesbergeria anulus]|uniref:Cyclic diguanosine monophosphate-binding protein n=1 Tax=Giesbergeria anulus TaxID=180197 RepID=A0A1H9ELC5_9BURK|nr:PilZ domain-containing protein [Giesbergeria anulus]SEQ26023.1 PilZ domain-containing protein [Giesbergeria anulus]
MSHERRHFTRVHFDAPALLKLDHSSLRVHILDLSLKGALVALPPGHGLESGTLCQLQLTLAPSNVHITMAVEVARHEEHQTGLRCLHMDLDSITHLRRLIEWQLGDAALLDRDLSQLVAGAKRVGYDD